MLFQSIEYLLLLITALLCVKYINNNKIKKLLLLFLSLTFYAWGSKQQISLFLSIIGLSYIFGIIVEQCKIFTTKKSISKIVLFICIAVLFIPLFVFKYCDLGLTLPIGISFYTFQAVGYVIDVYRNKVSAEKDFLSFACFISFFPQLVAGPIERADKLLPQIKSPKESSSEDYSKGFRLILLGLSLKVLIAETMAAFVDPVYDYISYSNGLAILVATVFFGIQIYCDFNGYTLIAKGSAQLLGISLCDNFDHPYTAISITDFWRKWHISLTSWFKDYVYIPLGGNRKGKLKTIINTLITFLLSGIWHGRGVTFAFWGLLNGVAVSSEKMLTSRPGKAKSDSKEKFFVKAIKFIVTYAFVNFSWIFFRANSFSEALQACNLIITDTLPQISRLSSFGKIAAFFQSCSWRKSDIIPLILSLTLYVLYEYGKIIKFDLFEKLSSCNKYLRWLLYVLVAVTVLYFGKILGQSAFVYFRF